MATSKVSLDEKALDEQIKKEEEAYLDAQLSKEQGRIQDQAKAGTAPSEELGQRPGGLAGFLEMLDSYTGAPARSAALPVFSKGLAGLADAPEAFKEQFGEPTATAPSGLDLARVIGIPHTNIPMPEFEPFSMGLSQEQIQSATSTPEAQKLPINIPADEAAAFALENALDPSGLYLAGLKGAYRGAKMGIPAARAGVGLAIKGAGKAISPMAKSAAEEAGEVAAGAIAGTYPAMEEGARVGKQVIVDTEKFLAGLPEWARNIYENLKPNVQKSFVEYVNLADRKGIPRDLVINNTRLLHGQEAPVTKLKEGTRTFNQGELEQHNKLRQEIADALDREKEALANGAPPIDQMQTGNMIRDAWNKAVSKIFDEHKIRYKTVVDATGVTSIDPDSQARLLNRLEYMIQEQTQKLKFAPTSQTESQIHQNINTLWKVANNILEDSRMDVLLEQLGAVGSEAYSTKSYFGLGAVTDKKLLQNVYNDLRQTVFDNIPEEAKTKLEEANKALTKFFKENEVIGKPIQDLNVAPEKIYSNLIASGDSRKLEALKNILGEDHEVFKQARVQFLDDLFKLSAAQAEQGKKSIPLFAATIKSMESNQAKRVLKAFFKPGELADYETLLKMGRDLGPAEYNTSKTGILGQAYQMMKNPLETLEAMATGDTIVRHLQVEGMKRYLDDLTPGQMMDVRNRNIFPPEIFDEALRKKLNEPEVRIAYNQAKKAGTIPPDVAKQAQEIITQGGRESYSLVKKYLIQTGMDLGVGIIPAPTFQSKINDAAKILRIYSAFQRENGITHPVFIPESETDAVREIIMKSKMDSIQKSKNMNALNRAGVILDIRGIEGEISKRSQILNNVIKKSGMINKKKATLEADKPDILKKLAKPEEDMTE